MPHMPTEFWITIIALTFGAGGAWFDLRRQLRHVVDTKRDHEKRIRELEKHPRRLRSVPPPPPTGNGI